MLFCKSALLLPLLLAANLSPRIAVIIDDAAENQPAQASIEASLQRRGYSVVSSEVSEKLRKVVAPAELLRARLPEGLSVFEADAILVGAISYGEAQDMDGVQTLPVSLTAKLIDLGTGKTTSTIQTSGRGIGIVGPELKTRGAKAAVKSLFKMKRFRAALKGLGQHSGSVTLIVQNLPHRDALLELKKALETAFAGAPVKEVYYAKGLGKLMLGGSKAKSMAGPQIADMIGENRYLALVVDEVANTRIVTRFDRARTVQIHALVLQPKISNTKSKKASRELGRYLASRFAEFSYARASFQPGQLTRKQALNQAKKMRADVIVESEIIGDKESPALAIRVVDTKTGRPLYREQRFLDEKGRRLQTAAKLLGSLQLQLPHVLASEKVGIIPFELSNSGPRTAETDLKELKD